MGSSFQEQLLKAGLVNKKQAKKIAHEKRVKAKQDKKSTAPETASAVNEALVERKKRDQELNRRLAEEKRQQEALAQVKQLIEQNRLARDERGEAYNFVDDNRIKRIHVGAEMAEQLSRGQLAIVRMGSSYEVVPAKVGRQVASRRPEALVVLHGGGRWSPLLADDHWAMAGARESRGQDRENGRDRQDKQASH